MFFTTFNLRGAVTPPTTAKGKSGIGTSETRRAEPSRSEAWHDEDKRRP